MRVKFKSGEEVFYAEFNDTPTAKEIIARLPIESVVSRWGDEIYFDIGFKASAAGASMEVSAGDVAYWSQGKSLCVFFGPTPASNDYSPVPASPVVVVGKTEIVPETLRRIGFGEKITVSLEGK
ncbi:MAG: cyclophilin-like fold protein [Candidatus Omnitrophota bacterium]